ncbi:MAG: molybdopterin-dependent oxidoreductase [Rhodobacter sp.]|nr:molybdopterin-dependent oxidoreductase [Rhodobacter sp.]
MNNYSTGFPAPPDRETMTRRSFLKTTTGMIALTVIGLPLANGAAAQGWAPTAGVATQRIEGVTKVTGAKIYARDYNARDLHDSHGWPQTQWYAMFLRALTTTRAFRGVDLSALPAGAQPVKTILGNDFASGRTTPLLTFDRDHIVEEQIAAARAEEREQAIASGTQIDKPYSVEFDLVVQPGNRADFLGQGVALLLFDSAKSYRAARRQMQFNDADYQVYGPEIGPNPDEPIVFPPETLYVKEDDPADPSKDFSYFLSNWDDYAADAKSHAENIETYLDQTPGLIKHRFTSDMRAMDPMFMEPESGLIWYDKPSKTMNVLLGTQSPDGDIADICSMYGNCGPGKPLEQGVLISCYPGGGFGGRDKSPFSLMLGLCADFSDGHPVKLEYDRFEQFRVGLKRHACNLQGLIAVTPDQKMRVVQMNLAFDGGGRKNLSPYVASLAALCAGGSYNFPMANIFANATHSENISGGSQRGFGGPQAFFATETAIDEIAVQQGWDPVDFRYRNVVEKGDTTVTGGPIDQQLRLREMLERTAEHPLWRERAEIKRGYAQRGLTYGTGLAMSLQAYGTSGDGVVAAITLGPTGTWDVQSDAVDMGNGSATTLGVAIGFVLGSNASTVEMGGYTLFGQTGLTADSKIGCDPEHPTWDNSRFTKKAVGSSSACLTGLHQVHVVKHTARAVFANTIIPAARIAWGIDTLTERDVHWVDGALMHGELEPLSLRALADVVYDAGLSRGAVAHGYFQESWVSADFETAIGTRRLPLDGLAYYPADGGDAQPVWRTGTTAMDCNSSRAARYVWAPCVNVVGLTVNRTTGAVRVENVLSVLNAGRIHVEPLVSGQSQGGVAMAIGYTLFEDMPPGMDGPANGTWNLNDYHVPRYHDVPLAGQYAPGGRSQELVIMPETPADRGQGRGIAEAVMCSVAPAISNALRDAVGVRYTSLPITAAKILEGLRT